MNVRLTVPRGIVCVVLSLLAAISARAQTTIDPVNRYAYAGNFGWIDCYADGVNGAVIGTSYCSGFIYSANAGWINLGNGHPTNGVSYTQSSAEDFGVNIDGNGNLSGYAWGANIGWINFDPGGSPQIVQSGPVTLQFSGYAYSANCGWISLNSGSGVQASYNYLIITGPTAETNNATAGSGSLTLFSDSQDFLWTAAVAFSGDTWLHLVTNSGAGSATLGYTCDPNFGPTRTSTIYVNGYGFNVTQYGPQAPSTIDPVNRYAYGANIGWLDWYAYAPMGAVVSKTYLSGLIYSGNVGWINLGDGAPANGVSYSQSTANDFGLNLDASGNLRGYAWSANIGWINFEDTGAAKVDLTTGQFSGYAWSANCGWISLATGFGVQTDTILPAGSASYVGNQLGNLYNGPDSDPPLVVLGEYAPDGSGGPQATSSLSLPAAGLLSDVKFLTTVGENYNFTLYVLQSTGSPGTGEQTFQVAASAPFSGTASSDFVDLQNINLPVTAGQLVAFAGVGPDYNGNDSLGADATYEDQSQPGSFTATAPNGAPGTAFTVGEDGDPNTVYDYISDAFGNQGRTYAFGVDVLAGATIPVASQLQVVATPATVAAGQTTSLTLKAVDSLGRVDLTAAQSVTLTSSDPNVVFTPSGPVQLAHGTQTVSVSFKLAGTQTVTVSDTAANHPLASGNVSITVNSGAPAQLQVLAPATAPAGMPVSVTVNLLDAYGNPFTSAGTANMASSDLLASVPSPVTFGTPFNVTFYEAGMRTLTATNTANHSVGGSATVTVSAGPVAQLQVAVPAIAGVGTPASITVHAYDAYGNTVASAVNITSSDLLATSSPASPVPIPPGSVSVTFNTPGMQTVTATVATNQLVTATSSAIAVAPPYAQLQILLPGETAAPGTLTGKTGAPGPQIAGTSFTVTLNAVDANFNVVPFAAPTLAVAAPADPNPGLPVNGVPLQNGTATFQAVLNTPGTQTLTATDNSRSIQTASAEVSVNSPGLVLFVSSAGANTLSMISVNAIISPYTPASGSGLLDQLEGMAFDSSNDLYVSDYGNNEASEITAGGVVSQAVTPGYLNRPEGLAFNSSGNGTLYIANSGNNIIYSLASGSSVPAIFAGHSLGVSDPAGLAFDGTHGRLYVANTNTSTVSIISTASQGLGTLSQHLNAPQGLGLDSRENLYVANNGDNTLSKFTYGGSQPAAFVTGTQGLDSPWGLALDSYGNIFVANSGNGTISEVTSNGTTVATFATGLTQPQWVIAAQAPIAPANIQVAKAYGECSALVFLPAPTGFPTPSTTYTYNGSTITSPYRFPLGVSTVSFTASNFLGSIASTFDVTVTDPSPPVAGPYTVAAIQGQPVSITVASLLQGDSAPGGGTLSIPGVTGTTSAGGSASLANGNITYNPPIGHTGTDLIYYNLSDGCGVVTGTITVSISTPGSPPVAQAMASSGQTATVAVPSGSGQGALTAMLVNGGSGSQPVTVTAKTYSGNPEAGDFLPGGSGTTYLDLEAPGAVAGDSMTAYFYYPYTSGSTPPSLEYFIPGTGWEPVYSDSSPPVPTPTLQNGTWQYVVVFDEFSTPTITELTGTAFALATSLPPGYNSILLTFAPSSISLAFIGTPGATYVIQSANAVSGPWANLSGNLTADASGNLQYNDTTSPQPAVRFYRTQYISGP